MPIHLPDLELQLRGIANARRLAILKELQKKKTMTVGDIAEAINLDIAPVSQHLRILKTAGIVEYKRRGKFVSYRLSLSQEEPIKTILGML